MKRLSIILVLVTAVMMVSCIKDDVSGADLKPGDSLPDFEVVMNDGSIVSDNSLKGYVSVVVFFSTVCPDCQQVLPQMQKIYDEYLPQGVKFILISREQEEDEIEPYWKECGYTMPYAPQKTRDVYEKFAQSRIPRVYICDKNGIIKAIFTDNPNPSYSDIKSAIESL